METIIRSMILDGLKAASGFAVPEKTLTVNLIRAVRPKPTEAQVKKELRFLLDKSFIHVVTDDLDGSAKYLITEKGEVYLQK